MLRGFSITTILLALIGSLLLCFSAPAEEQTSKKKRDAEFSAEQIEFFEKSVKPILSAKCFKCHGGEKEIRGELRLTSRKRVLAGGESGEVVSLDDPSESLLLNAISYDDADYQMPPAGRLSQKHIDILSRWVKMGLPWTPGDECPVIEAHGPPEVNDETRAFWSFQPVVRPKAPTVGNAAWVASPIDAFILSKLESEGLSPAPPAGKLALMRRAYYDLTGLPPKPADVERYLADKSPDAYEKLIDRLLASPHYGEKWGRHWLDLVHYAESNSYERDNPKPEVWRYRDYVIHSLNADKPFDQFYTEQLAGDEMPDTTTDSIIATGYYRLGVWDDESADPPLARYNELDDWVTITSQVMLGLTMNCCRCHDHKLDPLPQADYYRFLAFFHGVRSYQNGPDGLKKKFNNGNFVGSLRGQLPPKAREAAAVAAKKYDQQLAELAAQVNAIDKKIEPQLKGGEKDDFAYESNRVYIVKANAGKLVSLEDANRYASLVTRRRELTRQRSQVDAKVLCAKGTVKPPLTHIKIRGNAGVNGKEVEPGFPQVLGFEDPKFSTPPAGAKSSGRRLVLAQWITNPRNPLAARVLANRIWQYHFGRGIVRSPNNFGFKGNPPTHPQLLDWLAAELVQRGWRLKSMHKLMMMSNTYRMSSEAEPKALAKDPRNNFFWRFNMRRLTAEEIRDTILATNGRLNRQLGGPSIYPIIPKEVLAGQSKPGNNWHKSSERDRARRSVYVHVKRSLLVPILAQFDLADTDNTCPVRFESTQPTQALGMLNSAFLNEQAKVFSERLRRGAGDDLQAQVQFGLRLALSRPITAKEVARGVDLVTKLRKEENVSDEESLRMFCLMTLNLNEYVYLD